MKNIKLITTSILYLFLILSISCCDKKEESTLPVHDSGRIVTCKIDGVPWSHGTEWCPSCHSLETDYYSGSNELFFKAQNFLEDPFENSLHIYIYVDSIGPTTFSWYNAAYLDYNNPEECTQYDYYQDTLYNNVFMIEEFDPIKKKIRGTFEFRAISPGCQDTVLITDGYFDLNPIWHE